MGKARIVVLVGIAALVLAGCLRQSASYEINPNGTVDATISIGMHQDYIDPAQPYNGITAVQEVLDHFTTDTIVDNDYGDWVGYRIYLDDEPMSSFADPAVAAWDLQILSDGDTWVVYGIEYDSDQDAIRQTITDNDGYLDISILFRGGDLIEEDGAVFTMVPAPGVAQWDMVTITEQPYARGEKAPAVPPGPPDPVVTVIITPSPPPGPPPSPVVTPSETPSATPSPSESPAPVSGDKDDGIPVWVWGVGGLLLAAVVGLGTYALASRSKDAPDGTDEDPEPKDEAQLEEDAEDEDEGEDEA